MSQRKSPSRTPKAGAPPKRKKAALSKRPARLSNPPQETAPVPRTRRFNLPAICSVVASIAGTMITVWQATKNVLIVLAVPIFAVPLVVLLILRRV